MSSDSDDDIPLSGRVKAGVPSTGNPPADSKLVPPVAQESAAPSKNNEVGENGKSAGSIVKTAEELPKAVKPQGPGGGFSRGQFGGQTKAMTNGGDAVATVNNIVPKPAPGQLAKPSAPPQAEGPKPASVESIPQAAAPSQAAKPPLPPLQNGKSKEEPAKPPSKPAPGPTAGEAKPKATTAANSTSSKPSSASEPLQKAVTNASKPIAQPGISKPVQKPGTNAPKPVAQPGVSKPPQKVVGNGVQTKRILSDSDSEDDVPLNKRVKISQPPVAKPKAKPPVKPSSSKPSQARASKRKKESKDDRPAKKSKTDASDKKSEKKWETLHHSGVLFPPEYTPHGVKMLYDGKPVDLTPEQEEVASMYGVMIETDYVKKKQFNDNFWAAFKDILGKGHVIKSLDKCDFRPMYEHFMAEREAKKQLPKEEKTRLKEEKDAAEARFKVALVDGRKEGVGNFRVEPPGLFRGRGEHPKMGQLKRRIYPRDITINIGKGQPIPDHPYKGQKWKEIRHDDTVTWLAFWKDPISTKDFKYVWLAANSTFKSDSDLAKYEKARKLKDYVDGIREKYRADWKSKDLFKQQMGVALYFIDSLALRAGHEKDEDEADTVGCCTLKVENVEVMTEPANHIKFDFLGKDSIRYENQVEVDPAVWKLVKSFCSKSSGGKGKSGEDQVFDTLNATDLNNSLKDLMDGLSVKVFRTYNASITLDRLLHKESVSETVDEKKADYDRANKEVAILCNHQRAVPKGHSDQMDRLAEKLKAQQEDLDQLTLELKVLQGKAPASKLKTPIKKTTTEEQAKNRIARKKEQLAKLQVQSRSKEDLKTVALGTSKINYLDPRITIAWCKRQEVPIEKVFNKSLLSKFHWAMDAAPDFKF